jgi:hypothetical protein
VRTYFGLLSGLFHKPVNCGALVIIKAVNHLSSMEELEGQPPYLSRVGALAKVKAQTPFSHAKPPRY